MISNNKLITFEKSENPWTTLVMCQVSKMKSSHHMRPISWFDLR